MDNVEVPRLVLILFRFLLFSLSHTHSLFICSFLYLSLTFSSPLSVSLSQSVPESVCLSFCLSLPLPLSFSSVFIFTLSHYLSHFLFYSLSPSLPPTFAPFFFLELFEFPRSGQILEYFKLSKSLMTHQLIRFQIDVVTVNETLTISR